MVDHSTLFLAEIGVVVFYDYTYRYYVFIYMLFIYMFLAEIGVVVFYDYTYRYYMCKVCVLCCVFLVGKFLMWLCDGCDVPVLPV